MGIRTLKKDKNGKVIPSHNPAVLKYKKALTDAFHKKIIGDGFTDIFGIPGRINDIEAAAAALEKNPGLADNLDSVQREALRRALPNLKNAWGAAGEQTRHWMGNNMGTMIAGGLALGAGGLLLSNLLRSGASAYPYPQPYPQPYPSPMYAQGSTPPKQLPGWTTNQAWSNYV